MNRNYFATVALLPGVQFSPSTQMGNDTIVANGQSTQNNNVSVDGGYNGDDALGTSSGAQVRTPLEAIQEFQVITSMYDAEFGRAGGAVVNAVTKSRHQLVPGVVFGYMAATRSRPRTTSPSRTTCRRPTIDQARVGLRAGRADRQEQGPLLRQPRAAGRQPEPHAGLPDPARPRLLDRRGPQRLEHDHPLRSPDHREPHLGGPLAARVGAAVSDRRQPLDAGHRSRTRPTSIRPPSARLRASSATPRSTRSASPRPGNTGGTATSASARRAAAAAGRVQVRRGGHRQPGALPAAARLPQLPHAGQHRIAGAVGLELPGRGQLLLVRARQEGRPRPEIRRALQLHRAAPRVADQPERHVPVQQRPAVQPRQSAHLSRAAHDPHPGPSTSPSRTTASSSSRRTSGGLATQHDEPRPALRSRVHPARTETDNPLFAPGEKTPGGQEQLQPAHRVHPSARCRGQVAGPGRLRHLLQPDDPRRDRRLASSSRSSRSSIRHLPERQRRSGPGPRAGSRRIRSWSTARS